jgi:hypothetical protein
MNNADTLKSLCWSLASMLTSAKEAQMVEIWEALGLGGAASEPAKAEPTLESKEGHRRVGIWKAEADGSWLRDIALADEFTLWANIDRIPAKDASRRRIVLVGESVARGWFYDPAYTPAGVLSACLDRIASGRFEVVDLARTSLSFDQLMLLGLDTETLDADLVLFFAGNNWLAWDFPEIVRKDSKRRFEAAMALRQHGVPGFKAYLEQAANSYFTDQLASYFRRLSRQSAITFVLPAYNLLDWHWEMVPDVPCLAEKDVARWFQLSERAAGAFEQGDYRETEMLASEMCELDKGTAASGLELLARCKLERGLRDEACEHLTDARDAHSYLQWQTPRVHRCIEDAIRSASQRGDVSLVDLPAEFSKDAGENIPGRKFFLDHCHMTADGIRVAMAAAAETIARRFGVPVPDREQVLAQVPQPELDVQCAAQLAACMHSAHLGQPSEILSDHLRNAVIACPALAQTMADYLELQASVAPQWMCTTDAHDGGARFPSLRRSHRAGILGRKAFHETLAQVFREVLETTSATAKTNWESVLRSQHGVEAGNCIDLLDGWFSRSLTSTMNSSPRQFFVAHTQVTTFSLISGRPAEVTLCLTCRRHSSAGASTAISVNGQVVAEIHVTPAWRTWNIPIPAQTLDRVVNTLAIRWPNVPTPAKEVLEEAAGQMERGQSLTLWPIFGEIHALRASITSQARSSTGVSPAPKPVRNEQQ